MNDAERAACSSVTFCVGYASAAVRGSSPGGSSNRNRSSSIGWSKATACTSRSRTLEVRFDAEHDTAHAVDREPDLVASGRDEVERRGMRTARAGVDESHRALRDEAAAVR